MAHITDIAFELPSKKAQTKYISLTEQQNKKERKIEHKKEQALYKAEQRKAQDKEKKEMKEKKKKESKQQISKLQIYMNYIRNTQEINFLEDKNDQLILNKDWIDFTDPFIKNKFLEDNELDEILRNYNDMNSGDLVITFLNPDYETLQQKSITYAEAEQIVDTILLIQNENLTKFDLRLQKQAFLMSFLLLEDYLDEDEEMYEKEKQLNRQNLLKSGMSLKEIKKMEKNKEQQDGTKIIKKNKSLFSFDMSNLNVIKNFSLFQTVNENKKKGKDWGKIILNLIEEIKDYEIVLEHESSNEHQIYHFEQQQLPLEVAALDNQVQELEQVKKQEIQDMQIEQGRKNVNVDQPVNENEILLNPQIQEQQEKIDDLVDKKQDLEYIEKKIEDFEIFEDKINELVKHQDPYKKFEKYFPNFPDTLKGTIRKKFYKGGFMYKKVNEEDPTDFFWICKNNKARDFATLLRFTIMTKLTRYGSLHTRTFISSDGQYLYMVIKSNQAATQNEAASIGLSKQVELGYADLFSLEPCDSNFRPIRLKQSIKQAIALFRKEKKIKIEEKKDPSQKICNICKRGTACLHKIEGNVISIEQRARNILKIADKEWEDTVLWEKIAEKQIIVDNWIMQVADSLGYDLSNEKQQLMSDNVNLTNRELKAYYLYLEYLFEFAHKMERLIDSVQAEIAKKPKDQRKDLKKNNKIDQNKGFIYRLIFTKAIGDTNQYSHKYFGFFSSKNILKNMWSYMHLKTPFSPYMEYKINPSDPSKNNFRSFPINENNDRSVFLNMEKIKLCYSQLTKQIDITRLKQQNFIAQFFACQEPFQMLGKVVGGYYKYLNEVGLMDERPFTSQEERLINMYNCLSDEAEAIDFTDKSFKESTSFQIWKPWEIDIAAIRGYYGEKIALYFLFLSFYTKQLLWIALFGIIVQVIFIFLSKFQGVQNANVPTRAKPIQNGTGPAAGLNYFFGLVIVLWSSLFTELWKRRETLFVIRYGQENFEQAEAERPEFNGKYIRNISNDKINTEYYPESIRTIKKTWSLLLSLGVVVGVTVCVVFILVLKNYFVETNFFNDDTLNTTIPGILNSIQINIANIIYNFLKETFNRFENHKILSSYENSLIVKVFLFQFCNTFNSCFIIAYMSNYFQSLHLCKYSPTEDDNCFQQLKAQMTTIFVMFFVLNIPELLAPYIKLKLKEKQISKTSSTGTKVFHPFTRIDEYIESQAQLEPYMINAEVDGTVADYMELIIQYAFLTLFGLSFPLGFLLAFIQNIIEIQVDKLKLMHFLQRPTPQSAGSLGSWFMILEVIGFIGIFQILLNFIAIFGNAGLIAYTSGSVQDDKKDINFILLIFAFLIVKFLFRISISDQSGAGVIIQKRNKASIHRLQSKMAVGSRSVQPGQECKIIGGVYYDPKVEMEFKSNLLREANVEVIEEIKKRK